MILGESVSKKKKIKNKKIDYLQGKQWWVGGSLAGIERNEHLKPVAERISFIGHGIPRQVHKQCQQCQQSTMEFICSDCFN